MECNHQTIVTNSETKYNAGKAETVDTELGLHHKISLSYTLYMYTSMWYYGSTKLHTAALHTNMALIQWDTGSQLFYLLQILAHMTLYCIPKY